MALSKKVNLHVSLNYRFWEFYNFTLQYICDTAKMSENEREGLLNDGPLERYQMKFCIKTHPLLLRLKETYPEEEFYLDFSKIEYAFCKFINILKIFSTFSALLFQNKQTSKAN
jgi:hypothetical protein